MHDQPTRGPAPSPAGINDRLQAAVLTHLLHVHPTPSSVTEVRSELSDGDPQFADLDDIDRALRDLRCSGLLHRHGRAPHQSGPSLGPVRVV